MRMATSEFLLVPAFLIHGKKNWTLVSDLEYYSDLKSRVIVVPRGFITDLASIPRWARWAIPVNGRHRLAAVVHDYLCRERIGDRVEADKVFLEAMTILNVKLWRRLVMYWAVRAFTAYLGAKEKVKLKFQRKVS